MAIASSQGKYKSKLIIEPDPSWILDTLAKNISDDSDIHIPTGTNNVLLDLGKESGYNLTKNLIALGDNSDLFDLTSSVITTGDAIFIAELLGSHTEIQAQDLYEGHCPLGREYSYKVFKERNRNKVEFKLASLTSLFPELSSKPKLRNVFKFDRENKES